MRVNAELVTDYLHVVFFSECVYRGKFIYKPLFIPNAVRMRMSVFGDKSIEEMTNAERWAVFFQYLTDEEKQGKIIEITNREEGIAMALDTLANITQDEVEYARMSNLIKSQLDYQSGMVEARREGLREGFSKGHDEGLAAGFNKANLENAQKMKTMGFLAEQIQAVTGLPLETITQL